MSTFLWLLCSGGTYIAICFSNSVSLLGKCLHYQHCIKLWAGYNFPYLLHILKVQVNNMIISTWSSHGKKSKNKNHYLLITTTFEWTQGYDGSVLLDDTYTLQGEKKASINLHALKGFNIIDRIKNKLESECPRIVSCVDILTVAARDATILLIKFKISYLVLFSSYIFPL